MNRWNLIFSFVFLLLMAALIAEVKHHSWLVKENAELVKKLGAKMTTTVYMELRGDYIEAVAENDSCIVRVGRPIKDFGLQHVEEVK